MAAGTNIVITMVGPTTVGGAGMARAPVTTAADHCSERRIRPRQERASIAAFLFAVALRINTDTRWVPNRDAIQAAVDVRRSR